jgi:hypothetical protein
MRNQFERQLSRYCKEVVKHWSVPTGRRHVDHARWTIARLSGLTWQQVIDRFPDLKRYSEPETQVKKLVRAFMAELDPLVSKQAEKPAGSGSSLM